MPWIILIASAVLEAIWAIALDKSNGLTVLVPSLVFLVTTALSMVGLSWAIKRIPLGTAYAIWTGLGAALTASYAMLAGEEDFSFLKLVFLVGIVGAAIGLKAISAESAIPVEAEAGDAPTLNGQ